MFKVNVIAYLWDLEDEGVDRVLDRLQGEVGVSGVTVPVAAGRLRHLRRHGAVRRRVFQSDGGFFFQPHADAYNRTRLKPIVSGWLKARNPLSKVAAACRARNLRLRVAIDTRRIERIAVRVPTCATQSVFGDVSRTRVCPLNPDAAALFRAMVDDLARNYAVSAVELRDLDGPPETDLLAADDAGSLGPRGRHLFAVCWCESCLQAASHAGIDTDAAVHSAQEMLMVAIASGRPCAAESDAWLGEDSPVSAYVDHRADAHTAFVASLIAGAPCDCALHIASDADPGRLDGTGFFMVDGRRSAESPGEIDACCVKIRRALPSARVEAVVAIHASDSSDGTNLVTATERLADGRLNGVTFDHYGVMTDRAFASVKRAVRYAGRTAAGSSTAGTEGRA